MFACLGTLGTGAYGTVFGGTLDGAAVAWKTLTCDDDELPCSALVRDVLVPQLVPPHPNLVGGRGAPRLQGQIVWQPLELCGMDVATTAAQPCFTHDDAVVIALGAARGLAHLHAHRIIHRDIKMENILLSVKDDSLDVKLCDFSLSRVFGGSATSCATAAAEPWMTAYVCTQYTRPLELFPCGVAAHYGPEVDVWSLGATLWAMLARKYPFRIKKSQEFEAAMRAALGADGSALAYPAGARRGIQATVRRTIDPDLLSILVSMLNPEPSARPSIEAVIDRLSALGARPSPGTLLFVSNEHTTRVRDARGAKIEVRPEAISSMPPRGAKDAADVWSECRSASPPMPLAVAALGVLAARASAVTPAELADTLAAVSTSGRLNSRVSLSVVTRVRVPAWGLRALTSLLTTQTPFEACTLLAALAAVGAETEAELFALASRPVKDLFDTAYAVHGARMQGFFMKFPNAWSPQTAMWASWVRLADESRASRARGHELHVMRAADVQDADHGKPADVVGGDAVRQELGDAANTGARALIDEDRTSQQS